jgi:predicted nuclease of restriction endonuclease-like (RecB) superfamily
VSERPSPIPENYDDFLRDLKERIRSAQVRAALSVNRELVLLYWQLGRDILTRQRQQGWGAKVITKLSKDLRQAFPEMKGFSRTNLLYMRAFAEAYPDEQIVQAVLGQITWYHNIALQTLQGNLPTLEQLEIELNTVASEIEAEITRPQEQE